MGTGISKHFHDTKGSGSTGDSGIDLFSGKVTGHIDQSKNTVVQNGSFGRYNFDFGITRQTKEILDEEDYFIYKLFVAMCYLLRSKYTENKNEKLLGLLNAFDVDSSLDSSWFLKFKEFFRDKNFVSDYGFAIVVNFISRYFSDSLGLSLKIQKKEWMNLVESVKQGDG